MRGSVVKILRKSCTDVVMNTVDLEKFKRSKYFWNDLSHKAKGKFRKTFNVCFDKLSNPI